MKIKRLRLQNFAKFAEFECEFDGRITRLVGVNGSGKTTIGMTAIWAALKGIAERGSGVIGERFRFIGQNRKSADIELTLLDESTKIEVVVRNHITTASNDITFTAPDGYPIGQEWLNNLLSVAFMSAKNFCAMSSKEQAVILGIDVSDIDKRMERVKQEFTLLNRELKTIGNVVEVARVEQVNISDLLREKDEIDRHNVLQMERAHAITSVERNIGNMITERSVLENKLKDLDGRIAKENNNLHELPKPEPVKSAAAIVEKLQGTEETNSQAQMYSQYVERKAASDAKQTEIEANRSELEKLKEERTERIRSHSFGFDGLTVDDSGNLLLNCRPIKEPYFSKGEQELIVARLHASINPELKIRFIDDFELLDDDNQERIAKELLDAGFQIITAEVGKAATKDNTIVLRECKVVDGYNEKAVLL